MSKENSTLFETEKFFLALADKTRLRLLNLMRGGEVGVGSFVEILGESQPKISRHLAFLRSAEIVEARRDGKQIYYKIIEPENNFAAQLLQNTLLWLNSKEKMRSEYDNLAKTSNSPAADTAKIQTLKPYTSTEANIRRNQSQELAIFLL